MLPQNISATHKALAILARYPHNDLVLHHYDEDESFANALHNLIGADFEYPDYSHKSIGFILAIYKTAFVF